MTTARTFAVDDVEPATVPLPTDKLHRSVQTLLSAPILACRDYVADSVAGIAVHPLFAAAHLAYSTHYPLVISPDMVWLALLQGLARHVHLHAETLRHRLVNHEGKIQLEVERKDFSPRSPESDWPGVIADFVAAIKKHVGPGVEQWMPTFSTTGPCEHAAFSVALLDAYSPYFDYLMRCVCGIPCITLEGTVQDWRKLREGVELLSPFGLERWLACLRPIAREFERAADGDINLDHWRGIYKQRMEYGGIVINGWLGQLVPYLTIAADTNRIIPNPLLEENNLARHDSDSECIVGVTTRQLSLGISQAPFTCDWRDQTLRMEFLGGFLGVEQNSTSLALRPQLGWAVREVSDKRKPRRGR